MSVKKNYGFCLCFHFLATTGTYNLQQSNQ